MTDRPEIDGEHLRAAMHRHPAGRRRPLRSVPKDSHSWGQPSRPGSGEAAGGPLPVLFLAVLAAGILAGAWLDWRWLLTAVVVDLVVAFVGARQQQRRAR